MENAARQNKPIDWSEIFLLILVFTILHAVVALALAPTFVGDTAVLTALTMIMVMMLGNRLDADPTWKVVGMIALQALGADARVYFLVKLPTFGVLPAGSVANIVVTAGCTQVIGWTAYFAFKRLPGKK